MIYVIYIAILLDNIFILVTPGAPEAESLLKLGFVEGKSNVHSGQGTSNPRFFLHGLTIELLYVSDVEEATHGSGKNLGILARTLDNTASPIGIVVRVSREDSSPAFPNWQYIPDYFDGKMCFYVGDNSSLVQEPLCI